MKLNKEDIKHIAELARLELTEEELEKYGRELSAILGYIEQLKEVDTDGIDSTAQITGLVNAFRADEIKEWDEKEAEAALAQAPLEDGQIKVKRVLNNGQ